MTETNRDVLKGSIATNLPDNTSGEITAADIRNELINIADSAVFKNTTQTIPPVAGDDINGTAGNGSFGIGDVWIDTASDNSYICANNIANAAIWQLSTVDGAVISDGNVATDQIAIWQDELTVSSTSNFTYAAGVLNVTGTVAATTFTGDGSVLTGVASSAQGALADTAVQPADIGTAAATDIGDYAVPAQGALADTAVQPADIGTAAATDIGDYAVPAQGALADTSVQPADIGTAAATDIGDYAVPAQGALADTAVQPADIGTAAATDIGDYAVPAQGALADTSLQSNEDLNFDGMSVAGIFELTAIAESKLITAVDGFVYDTSFDTDGGAWIDGELARASSWYNETLNTATRGGTRAFPVVAVIIAESDTVTIYDGDDPDLPMWMVATQSVNAWSWIGYDNDGSSAATSISALNGKIIVGSTGSGSDTRTGLAIADFLTDSADFLRTSSNFKNVFIGNISERIGYADGVDSARYPNLLVNGDVNDVAMTVLPDAPIDPSTGIQIPTIAVATTLGVSIIKDDGVVVDIYQTSQGAGTYAVEFEGDSVSFSTDSNISKIYWRWTEKIPDADVLLSSLWYTQGTADEGYNTFINTQYDANTLKLGIDWDMRHVANGNLAGIKGLIPLAKNTSNYLHSLFANVTSTYNTGWMVGDIRGAWLSSTDATDLVGVGELVANGTFDTDLTGWTLYDPDNSTAAVNGANQVEVTNTVLGAYLDQIVPVTIGQTYVFNGDFIQKNGGGRLMLYDAVTTSSSSQYVVSQSDVTDLVFVARTAQAVIRLGEPSASGALNIYDNLSIRAVDADRSINSKPLTVTGTITKAPVATGAELMAYSGFGANYLEQPYNADLDFGTGDFSIMGWSYIATGQENTNPYVLRSNDVDIYNYILLTGLVARTIFFQIRGDSGAASLTSTGLHPVDSWFHVCALRRSGVMHIYLNGVAVGSDSGASGYDLTSPNADHILRFGKTNKNQRGDMALWRISATAPSAAQLAKIYEDELHLFRDNALAVLSDDSVTALSHDPITDLLYVGGASGMTTIAGITPVSRDTTAVSTFISVVDGMEIKQ